MKNDFTTEAQRTQSYTKKKISMMGLWPIILLFSVNLCALSVSVVNLFPMRLAAIILAVILMLPGHSWSQGPGIGTKAQSGPMQTDKTFTQEQQKKRLQQMKNPKKQSQGPQKGKKTSRSQATEQPMRGGPIGPAGK